MPGSSPLMSVPGGPLSSGWRKAVAPAAARPGLDRLHILIVDDEPANVHALTRILEQAGYRQIRPCTDPRTVLDAVRSFQPDLILLDINMPYKNGFEVMEELAEVIPQGTFLPILVLTAETDPLVRQRALALGGKDFVNKPFEITEVLLRIRNLLETRMLHLETQEQNERLEARVRHRTRELADARLEILHRLARAAEYRDDITGHHAERVGVLSALLARELGDPVEDVELVRRAAPLHDLGKIGVPDSILMKPGPLTVPEYEVMKTHTEIGYQILSGSNSALLKGAASIARYHHERWDGKGYPMGLADEAIPRIARIVAVADVFDCLTHVRPYKGARPPDESVDEIVSDRGRQFDPDVVDALVTVRRGMDLARLIGEIDTEDASLWRQGPLSGGAEANLAEGSLDAASVAERFVRSMESFPASGLKGDA